MLGLLITGYRYLQHFLLAILSLYYKSCFSKHRTLLKFHLHAVMRVSVAIFETKCGSLSLTYSSQSMAITVIYHTPFSFVISHHIRLSYRFFVEMLVLHSYSSSQTALSLSGQKDNLQLQKLIFYLSTTFVISCFSFKYCCLLIFC